MHLRHMIKNNFVFSKDITCKNLVSEKKADSFQKRSDESLSAVRTFSTVKKELKDILKIKQTHKMQG